MNIKEDNSHAFIVPFWLEPRKLEDAKPIRGGVVEHVASGQWIALKGLDEITAFIDSICRESTKYQNIVNRQG